MGREIMRTRGWVVVVSIHAVFLLWGGLLKSIGVLLPALQNYFDTNVWLLGWIIAVVCATNNTAALFGIGLSSLIGGRRVVILSGLMAAGGLLLASLSSTLLEFALALTALTGIGYGAALCMSKVYLGFHFSKGLSLATGMAMMGVPESFIIFPPFAQLLLQTYGVQGTLLVLCGLTLHIIPLGLLFCPPSDFSQHTNERKVKGSDVSLEASPGREIKSHMTEFLDVKMLTSLTVWILILPFSIFAFVNDSWMTFMVANALVKGYEPFVAVTFSVIAGITAVIFSVLQGVVLHRGLASARHISAIAAGAGSIALLVNPLLNNYLTVGVSVAVYGMTLAVLNPALVCLTVETMGKERAGNAYGWMGLVSGIFRILFGFSTGLLYDMTGSYDATFILLGAMLAAIVPILFIDTLVDKCRNSVEKPFGKRIIPWELNLKRIPTTEKAMLIQPKLE